MGKESSEGFLHPVPADGKLTGDLALAPAHAVHTTNALSLAHSGPVNDHERKHQQGQQPGDATKEGGHRRKGKEKLAPR